MIHVENELLVGLEDVQIKDAFIAKEKINIENNTNERKILVEKLLCEYKKIEDKTFIDYNFFQDKQETPVNFKQSMQLERHRWFPYKEGFSPLFVESFINRFTNKRNIKILDVFSGVGTTVLQAGLMGFEGVGFDVNPLSNFIAKTKSISLDIEEQSKFISIIEDFSNATLDFSVEKPDNKTVVSYFSERNIEWLLKLKFFYTQLEDPYQALFKLVFLRIIEPLSTHRKDGNGVKRKTNLAKIQTFTSTEYFKEYVVTFLKLLLEDIKKSPVQNVTTFHLKNSLENSNFEGNTFNAVLTSPPYANCFDYSKVYLSELWLGDFFINANSQKDFRRMSVRSHVHASWKERFGDKGSEIVNEIVSPYLSTQKLWSNKIPAMLCGYFKDMGQILENLFPILEDGTPIGLVVGNSVYDGIPIATDLLLCEIGERIGYKVEKIEVYRKLTTSSQQLIKVENKEYLRESLVVLRKI